MIEYGFFDSELTGYDDEGIPVFDRAKSSEFFADFWKRLVSDGVLGQPSDCFQVVSTGGMNISVKPGFGFIQGHYAKDEQEATYTIESISTGKRIDLVVFRLNRVERLIEIIIKKGATSSNPIKPTLVREPYGDYYELCLAEILVDSMAGELTQSAITDTRMNSNICGIVVCPINKLETSVFYNQINAYFTEFKNLTLGDYADFQATINNKMAELALNLQNFYQSKTTEFNTWFDSIKSVLSGDVAGNLLNEIMDLKNGKADKSVLVSVTIPSASWVGSAVPFTNRIAIATLKTTNNAEVVSTDDVTVAQIEAFASTSIQSGYIENGYLVLKAYGDKPQIDLPIMVILRNDISGNGNVLIHLPGGSGGKGGKFIGGTKLSQYATTPDTAAQNNIISVTSSYGYAMALFDTVIDDLELGCYAVMLRLKVSNNTNTNNLINIRMSANNANGALLAEYNIKPEKFKKVNTYQTIGMIVELSGVKGTKLHVSAILPANATAITVGVDYLLVAPAFTAVSAIG